MKIRSVLPHQRSVVGFCINFPALIHVPHLLGIAINQNNDRSAGNRNKINEMKYEILLQNRFHVASVVE